MQPLEPEIKSTTTNRHSPALMFFNELEARTVEALVARVIPTEPNSPGAREAGVVIYIDRAVAGYFRDLQTLYRAGIQELNEFSESRCGAAFADLSDEQQDSLLAELGGQERGSNSSDNALRGGAAVDELRSSPSTPNQRPTPESEDSLLTRFFAVVCDQTIQGMFCDPIYEGNRNGIGWKLIGFPGAQWGYSADQLRPGYDATTLPVQTLTDLRRRFGGGQHG
jgi:gluconate 2-dehydrogenase gamma chain